MAVVKKDQGTGKSGADRPAATRMAKDASGINPDQRGPIHPAMPHMPPA